MEDTKVKHTQGPWFADGRAICGNGTTIDVDGSLIAMVSTRISHGRCTRDLHEDEIDGNCRLIAQAPAMLAFIREWRPKSHGPCCMAWIEKSCTCGKSEADAILASVEGK